MEWVKKEYKEIKEIEYYTELGGFFKVTDVDGNVSYFNSEDLSHREIYEIKWAIEKIT